jgi:hypothetical protein
VQYIEDLAENQCCGYGMFIQEWIPILSIQDPGSWIPDPKTVTKKMGEKNYFVATNITKLNLS